MKCDPCPRPGRDCLGERLPHLCGRADYRDYLAGFDVEANRPEPPPAPEPRTGPVRVGFLCPVLVHGGAEAVQLATARFVQGVEWSGCVVTHGIHEAAPAMVRAFEAFMPVGFGEDAARDLARRSDLLITWAVPEVPQILRGVEPRPKVVSIAHAPADSEWGRNIYRISQGVDRFVAVSTLALEAMPPDSGAVVIPNAVDTTKLAIRRSRAEVRAGWAIPADAPVAGYCGRLSDEKDPFAMIRLARALPDPWQVVVVGEGYERSNMEAELRRHPCPRIRLVGADPATGDVLNAFDVVVVPSKFESFGLTIAEALWMGKPLVATKVGILKEHPRPMARLVPVGADGETLARAVLGDVLVWPEGNFADPFDSDREIAAARAEYRPRLDPARFAREWERLIAEMVPRRPTPGLAREIRLTRLRRECPHASTPPDGCGCSDERVCSLGRGTSGRASRAQCFECLEDAHDQGAAREGAGQPQGA